MESNVEERLWSLVATASAVLAAMAVRTALSKGWRTVTDDEPPENPASSDTGWREALAWTALTGAAVGITRLLAERGSTAGWKAVTGEKPPGV